MCQLFALLQSSWPRMTFQARHEVQKSNQFYFTHMLQFESDRNCVESFLQCVTTGLVISLTASHREQAASVSLLSHECINLSLG